MIVKIGTVTAQFLFWEYLFQIFGIVSLQCALNTNPGTSVSYSLLRLSTNKML
jgi:hypothetical protein